MCSYCRARLLPFFTPRGGTVSLPSGSWLFVGPEGGQPATLLVRLVRLVLVPVECVLHVVLDVPGSVLELPPTLLCLAFELLRLAFDAVAVHVFSCSSRGLLR